MITNESIYSSLPGSVNRFMQGARIRLQTLRRMGGLVFPMLQLFFRSMQQFVQGITESFLRAARLVIQGIVNLILRNRLVLMLLVSAAAFIASGDILRMVDVTAAPIDLGILAVLPLSAVTVISFLMLTEWLIAWQWPVLDAYQHHFLEKTFKHLLSWQKALIYFSFYLALLYSFISVTKAFL